MMLNMSTFLLIMKHQSSDQAAYRSGFSTEDHLVTLALLVEACDEWRQELWLALVVFEKAFDAVEHAALWKVLRDVGIEEGYIVLLRKLYREQTATVIAGEESRQFSLGRGVKQ